MLYYLLRPVAFGSIINQPLSLTFNKIGFSSESNALMINVPDSSTFTQKNGDNNKLLCLFFEIPKKDLNFGYDVPFVSSNCLYISSLKKFLIQFPAYLNFSPSFFLIQISSMNESSGINLSSLTEPKEMLIDIYDNNTDTIEMRGVAT